MPSRPLRSQARDPVSDADFGIRLTGAQAKVQDGLCNALLGSAPCIMLTGAAGVGKTAVLAAALSCITEPERRVLWLDDPESGMEEAFGLLFPSARTRSHQRSSSNRRLTLVLDQMEAKPPGSFTYLELLSRMPGKAASIQWVFAGRSEPWSCLDSPATAWLREVGPACLALSPLLEQDAWELFHHRVNPARGLHPAAKLVSTLLKQSEGMPGRFDAAVKAAVAAGLLQGVRPQAA